MDKTPLDHTLGEEIKAAQALFCRLEVGGKTDDCLEPVPAAFAAIFAAELNIGCCPEKDANCLMFLPPITYDRVHLKDGVRALRDVLASRAALLIRYLFDAHGARASDVVSVRFTPTPLPGHPGLVLAIGFAGFEE